MSQQVEATREVWELFLDGVGLYKLPHSLNPKP